jgi:putative phosphoesterase
LRIGVLSDVHGNLPALEAVLRDAAGRSLEALLHLGDLVGYGQAPDEVVARVRAEGISGVVGDWDLAVLHPDPLEGLRSFGGSEPADGRRRFEWTRERISEETRAYLRELPAQLRVEEGPLAYLFTHGSPEHADEPLFAEVPEERLLELFTGTGADVLLVGHTHRPQVREVGACLLLNPGSVGVPSGSEPRASYLILDTTNGLRVEHVQVEFGVESLEGER